ncbi:MAG: alpha/beta hydrolase [Myxococcota bacterium]
MGARVPVVTTFLTHARVRLALHELRSSGGPPLLLLHGLGERSPSEVPETIESWRGSIFALDFTGHGASTVPRGGGYSAELLMADADVAIAELGRSTVLGRGVGAYAALLLAGARPREVHGAILCDGPGLVGGGPRPGSPHIDPAPTKPTTPDPCALSEMAQDVRPPDYATSFVRQATHISGLARPITVCAREQPDWLRAVIEEPGVEAASLDQALAFYADAHGSAP